MSGVAKDVKIKRKEVKIMRKLIAAGWLRKCKVPFIGVEAAFLADEMGRIRDDVKWAEFRAKLFAARREKQTKVGLGVDAIQQSRWYCGQTNLDAQFFN